MAHGISAYASRSMRLIVAAQQLADSLQAGEDERELAIEELLAATKPEGARDIMLGFEPGIGAEPASPGLRDPDDALSAAVLDLQSANLLVSAEIVLNKSGAEADPALIDKAVGQASSTRAELLSTASTTLGFEAKLVHSATLDDAKLSFRSSSKELLGEIVSESTRTVRLVIEVLRSLDPGKILEALGQLGNTVPIIAAGGRLVHRAIDLVKRALDTIASLFGKPAFEAIKQELGGIWEKCKSGEYAQDMLGQLLGVPAVTALIERKLTETGKDAVDGATNELGPVAADFTRKIKLVRAAAVAIGSLAGVLHYFQLVAPTLSYGLAAVSLTLMAAAILTGGAYIGERRILQWVRGVKQVVEAIPSAA